MFDKVSDMRFLMDLESCFNIFGGWLECIVIYSGFLLGLQMVWFVNIIYEIKRNV